MSNSHGELTELVSMQKWSWYFLILVFAVAAIFYVFDLAVAAIVAGWGVAAILVVTVLRLVAVAGWFERQGERRYKQLSYLLILIMALGAAVKFWVL